MEKYHVVCSNRKTIGLEIKMGVFTVRAPYDVTDEQIAAFVE